MSRHTQVFFLSTRAKNILYVTLFTFVRLLSIVGFFTHIFMHRIVEIKQPNWEHFWGMIKIIKYYFGHSQLNFMNVPDR